MAFIATTGAMCMCTCGSCPSAFNATPSPCLCNKMPIGTIMDNVPMFNIMPFGACSIMLGSPCVPATPAPWIPGKPTVLSSKKPTLTTDSQLQCALGGVIKFIVPAEFTTILK